jgi:hypothetical protein
LGRFALGAPSASLAAALAVELGPEDGDDGEDVFGEVLLVGSGFRSVDDDSCAVVGEDVLDEVVCEAAEAVAVRDVDSAKSAFECELEQGAQASSFEVDATGDVAEDDCVWVVAAEGGELSLEVAGLLACADSGVDSVDSLFWSLALFSADCLRNSVLTTPGAGCRRRSRRRLSKSGTRRRLRRQSHKHLSPAHTRVYNPKYICCFYTTSHYVVVTAGRYRCCRKVHLSR